jgi:hypothetical protein
MKQKIKKEKQTEKEKHKTSWKPTKKMTKKNKTAKKPSAWNVCGPAHLGNMGTCQAANRSEEVRVNVKIITTGDE